MGAPHLVKGTKNQVGTTPRAQLLGCSTTINLSKGESEVRWSDMLTPSRESVEAARALLWVEGYRYYGQEPGGFHMALIGALQKADYGNRRKLIEAFPQYDYPITIMTTAGGGKLEEWVVDYLEDNPEE